MSGDEAPRQQITQPLVPRTGLEPVRPNGHQILSLACLPIPSPRHKMLNNVYQIDNASRMTTH